MRSFICAVAMSVLCSTSLNAAVISNIQVSGNQRIETPTILSYMKISPGDDINTEQVNTAVRNLFETGLFEDVSIAPSRSGDRLIVRVIENAVINQIVFEGNERIEDAELAAQIRMRERTAFTKARAEGDAQSIIELYRRTGRYAAEVEPKIIELSGNRVNVVFEISEGAATGVKSISFVGNQIYSDNRLRRVIETDESTWWNFLSGTDTYDPDRLEYDKELLRQFYLARGYADFEVVSAVAELSPDREGFFVTITIDEGEPYNFGKIAVNSTANTLPTDVFEKFVVSETGDIYNADEVQETIEDMTFQAGQEGFPFVRIRPQAEKNEETRTIDLTYNLEEGPRVYVERIEIEGNIRTLDKVIRREFDIAEGDAYDALEVQQARSRIRALGFFQVVDITTEEGTSKDQAVIKVKVEERSTGDLSFGIGFSSAESIGGEVSITERNFLGRGQYVRLGFSASTRRQYYDLRFTEPYFLDRDLNAGFDLYRREIDNQDESSFDERNTGFRPRLSFPLGKDSRFGLYYQISKDEIRDVPDDASILIQNDEESRLTSAIGYSLTYDKRDDYTYPTSGYRLSFDQAFAGLGGDTQYVESEVSAIGYVPLYEEDVIFSLELAAGNISSWGDRDVRITDRYFLGGDSFRGFKNSGVGPRDQITRDALGGESYAIARSEIRFPLGLPEEYGITGGLFADAGTLFSVEDNTYTLNGNLVTIDDEAALRVTIGAIIYWNSPFGPVKFNFGQPVIKEDGDQKEFFRFSAGTAF